MTGVQPTGQRRLSGRGDVFPAIEAGFGTSHKEGFTDRMPTWKTLIRAWGKLSKLLRRTSVSSKSYLPPKSCMPRRAKMIMKRKSSSNREAMERMELSSEATRLLSDVQYLRKRSSKVGSGQSLPVGAEEGWRQWPRTGHNRKWLPESVSLQGMLNIYHSSQPTLLSRVEDKRLSSLLTHGKSKRPMFMP